MRDDVSDRAYAAGWGLVKRMPESVARASFNGIADQMWLQHGAGVQQLERNLRRVVGPGMSRRDLRRLSRAGMRSYLRYWCEAFRIPEWSEQRIVDTVECEGEEIITSTMAAGRGMVMALAHSGNWDHAGAWITLKHLPLSTVAERLKPESLYDRFLEYRRGLGMEVLPLGDRMVLPTLRRRLESGGLVCLLADRDLSATGIRVDFFGETTKLPAGPALLAYLTGADLLPVSTSFTPDGLLIRINPPIIVDREGPRDEVVRHATQQVADGLAKEIAARPEDWHMLQRLWLSDLTTGAEAGAPR